MSHTETKAADTFKVKKFYTYTNVTHRNKGSRHIQGQETFTHIQMSHTGTKAADTFKLKKFSHI